MVRVTIHSRTGNRVLAIAGAIYAIAGIGLFAWFVVNTWGAASIIDRAMQVMLLGAIALGVWFIYIARVNLTTVGVSSRPHARQRPANAEATS
jgi:hypothetical protein